MHAQSSKQPKADGIFRHLYTLRSPVYYAGRPDQYWALRLASTLRHQITVFPGAPHGYYLVPDGQNQGGQEIFSFFKGDDVMKALDDLRQARQATPDTQSAQPTATPSISSSTPFSGPHSGPGSFSGANTRLQTGPQPSAVPPWGRPGAASHSGMNPLDIGRFADLPDPPLPATSPATQPSSPPDIISDRDRNTLTPLRRTRATADAVVDSMYVLELMIDHTKMPGVLGQKYFLVVDTGAATL
ncbi:hypothetical protein C8Q77DRAFT_728498 [Trametes polyzona]|nr:hypothetical protein C8Q77DRAFT_728498 [Trametes polyzona]